MPINEFKRTRAITLLNKDIEYLREQAEKQQKGVGKNMALFVVIPALEDIIIELMSPDLTNQRLDEIDQIVMNAPTRAFIKN